MAHRSRCYTNGDTWVSKYSNSLPTECLYITQEFSQYLYNAFWRYVNDFADVDDDADSKGISQWTDLAKIACDGIDDGPPPRQAPGKNTQPKDVFLDTPEDSDSLFALTNELDKDEVKR